MMQNQKSEKLPAGRKTFLTFDALNGVMHRIASSLRDSRNPKNIRNPHIYCVNGSFLMFLRVQGQKVIPAGRKTFLTFDACITHYNLPDGKMKKQYFGFVICHC
ncbi:MAG TPA: hypothetical protein PLN48_05600 [Lachnospiraceae bacterium]|nr:hypothetical protein [Lachnospiraceae bacterium]